MNFTIYSRVAGIFFLLMAVGLMIALPREGGAITMALGLGGIFTLRGIRGEEN